MAMPSGPLSTGMALISRGRPELKLIGVTTWPLATYAVAPLGAMAIASGALVRSSDVTCREEVLITLTD